jgi:SET domain-containing protein
MEDLIFIKETPGRGRGVFAARDIEKDEIITEYKGPYVKIEDMEGIPKEVWDHLFNIGIDEYVITRDPGARTNHSCDPNAGIVRGVFLAAMRNIKKDEEVTFDYSTIIADDWKLECKCGSPHCRKTIGNYVDLPAELKRKYEKYTPDWIKKLSV